MIRIERTLGSFYLTFKSVYKLLQFLEIYNHLIQPPPGFSPHAVIQQGISNFFQLKKNQSSGP